MQSDATNASPRQDRAISVVTLGCPKNLADSESMLGQLHRAGFRAAAAPEDADLIVVNTCAFLTASQEESIDTILRLGQLKGNGRLKKLVVAGCLSERHGPSILDELPEVDYLLGPGTVHQVVQVAEGLLGGELERGASLGGLDRREFEWEPRVLSGHRHTAYLKISEGCNNTCSFCIIPQLRGKHRSRPVEDIEAEARRLAGFGVSEFTLIAQDLTCYGLDLYGRFSLPRLLERLNAIDGLRWIRLLYTYPRSFTDELIDAIGNLDRVLPYVDLPIQHISETVLRRMRRGLGTDATIALLQKLRAVPGMVLRTTVITGSPGETDEEFRTLLEFLKSFEFDHLGAFAYSTEAGTRAGEDPNQLPEELRLERRNAIMLQQRGIAQRRNRARIGSTLEVLIDARDAEKGWAQGRWYGQAPEIDGEVRVTATRTEGIADLAPGSFVRAKVRAAGPYDLVAIFPTEEVSRA